MPLNRFIAFFKPYINLLAGAIAAFLIAKANVLGIPGLGENGDELTTGIAAALAWIVTQGVTELGDLKWLKGHHLAIAGDAQVQAALMTAAPPPPSEGATPPPVEASDENLPSDEEEFAIGVGAPTSASHGGAAAYAGVDAEYDFDAEDFDDTAFVGLPDDDLPDDDEELSAPPPDESNMPVQYSQVELQGAPA